MKKLYNVKMIHNGKKGNPLLVCDDYMFADGMKVLNKFTKDSWNHYKKQFNNGDCTKEQIRKMVITTFKDIYNECFRNWKPFVNNDGDSIVGNMYVINTLFDYDIAIHINEKTLNCDMLAEYETIS